MSFLTPGSKFGNFIDGARKALPGLIGGGSEIAKGIANIFDPSGGWGNKIGAIGQGAQDLFNGPSNFQDLSNQFKNRDYSGMMGSIGNMVNTVGGAINHVGGSFGGKFGQGMRQAGNYMERGSDIGNMAGAMYDSGRAMYRGMRDRVDQGRNQIAQRDFGNFGENIGGGMQDMMNFGNQMMNQGQRMAGIITPAVMPDSYMQGNMMTPRSPSNRAVSKPSLPKAKRYASDY